jgi:DNA-binding MarR family transcriptional regulator
MDRVDRILAQWAREMPDVGTRGSAVLGRIRRIVLAMRGEIELNFALYELDAGGFDVLAMLRRAGAPYTLRPTELYRTLMISSGGLTARLDKLEEAGFIRRRDADDDGRGQLVELTPAGRKRIEAAFRRDMEVENRMLEGLSDAEHASLVRLLRKLALAMHV